MHEYNDFKYVEYIMGLYFYDGYELFLKSIKRFENEIESNNIDKIWDIYLLELQSGYSGSFDDYYKHKIKKYETNNLTKKEKKSEEERILNNVIKLDDKKLKKRVIM
jgi:hypothetical protein